MTTRRMMSLGVLLLVTLPWALSLSVLGLWLMRPAGSVGLPGVLGDPDVAMGVGLSSFASGQIVFLMCVCDRVFPRASRRLVVACEGFAGLVFAGALVGLGLRVI